ncbi:MAG TPA: VTT domain-containing protein [Planctomycetota bacterium]|nr:VTT domain-containing protein [Planctomycetota bacterium]
MKFGGPGLIALGILDSSVLPTFGALDLLLIFLSSANPEWWWYYGLMALIGSVIGAWLTYRLARKGGKEALEKKLGKNTMQKVYAAYEKHSFWAVFVPAILPPPFPTSPFLVGAGALKCPLQSFLVPLVLARTIRYGALAWLASQYGRSIATYLRENSTALTIVATVLAIGAGGAIAYFMWRTHKKRKGGASEAPAKEAA